MGNNDGHTIVGVQGAEPSESVCMSFEMRQHNVCGTSVTFLRCFKTHFLFFQEQELMMEEVQDKSTSASVSPATPPGGEELLGAVGGRQMEVGGTRAAGFPLELLEAASFSGESGVFTYTSAESR